jgi:hypothetical protein
MEGFKDMFWLGDKIVWMNLLKHYLLCFLGGRLKTGQWWSIQNQPLDSLVTALELCWRRARRSGAYPILRWDDWRSSWLSGFHSGA